MISHGFEGQGSGWPVWVVLAPGLSDGCGHAVGAVGEGCSTLMRVLVGWPQLPAGCRPEASVLGLALLSTEPLVTWLLACPGEQVGRWVGR